MQAIGAKKMDAIACLYVKMVKWSIPPLRIFFKNTLTMDKAKFTIIITITGFHSSWKLNNMMTLYFSLFVICKFLFTSLKTCWDGYYVIQYIYIERN